MNDFNLTRKDVEEIVFCAVVITVFLFLPMACAVIGGYF